MAAYEALEAASRTDEEGKPRGDVAYAQTAVYTAETRLASAERGLHEANAAIERVNAEKLETIRNVDRYTEGENGNLQQLQELQNKRFGGNVNGFITDLVARMNSGEEAKARLLQSMGQSTSPKNFSASAAGSVSRGVASGAKSSSGKIGGYGSNRVQSSGNKQLGSGTRQSSNKTTALRQSATNWISSLSDEQKRAIYDYTREGPYYKNINGVLRGRTQKYEEGNEIRSSRIHEALQSAQLPVATTVYRGVNKKDLNELAYSSDAELVGDIYLDRGYISTSMSRGAAFQKEVMLELSLPAGCHAACIEDLSAAGKYEQEVLIDRGHFFRITGVRYENDQRIICATLWGEVK